MLFFNEQMHNQFKNNCKKVYEKEYEVSIVMPSIERRVVNVLMFKEQTTNPGDVIVRGAARETWVMPLEKVLVKYSHLDGRQITLSDFVMDKVFKVKTKTREGSYCFALQIPEKHQIQVIIAPGEQICANRVEVEHNGGDYIVCNEKDGKPDLSKVWVVNGRVFPLTYANAGEKSEKYDKTTKEKCEDKNAKLITQARNPNLSQPVFFKDEQYDSVLRGIKSIASLDPEYNQGKVKITFIAELTDSGRTFSAPLKECASKNGSEIAYCINNKPVIIKNIADKYKTLRGIVSGLFSAANSSGALDIGEECGIISGVWIEISGETVYRAELSQIAG